MKKRLSKNLTLKRLLKIALLFVVLICTGIILYSGYLSFQIEKRFSARRWRIPSKVFSDVTLLYPGQQTNRDLFHEKLRRLGYREVSYKPDRKGEVRISRSVTEIFLHDLIVPSQKRMGFPVEIRFTENEIKSILRHDNGKSLPILELEPEEIMLFFGPDREQRQLVSIDQVPQHLMYAIMAAEDNCFYSHHGVDPMGICRAIYTNLRHGSIRQGGSTITQQLAKNYFLTPQKTLLRKIKELFMSLTIEVMYDKNEIFEIYLNEIYLGQKGSVSINGVGEASHFYFGKPVAKLSLNEAAIIAGLIKGPNHYSPYVDKNRCLNRRNMVMRAMNKNGWISGKELNAALGLPVKTAGFTVQYKKAPYFLDYLSEQLTTLYSHEDLSSLGLSIYTTLDTEVQIAAEKALAKGLARLEKWNPGLKRTEPDKKLQGAVIVMQPKTGCILAMAGGRNYSVSQFNRITQAKRQAGSTFKPFTFLSALDKFTPASILSNQPKSYMINGKIWQPKNYGPVPEEYLTMRNALAKSVNRAAVDLAMKVGLDHIVNTVNGFHFSTPIKPYPSLSLGSLEVIPLELARAYCAFAADGMQPYLLSLKEVVDENGKNLEQRHMTINRVISPAKAFIMTSLLQSVVTKGTARSLKKMGVFFPVAGKTGTTNNSRDAWFIGYTPDILALVWVGFDNGDSIHATGATAALPIWADLMNAIPQYISGDGFKMPPGVVKRTICSESGQLAVPHACPKPMEEVFPAENAPSRDCSLHQKTDPFKKFIKGVKKSYLKIINH
ncbi:MAG: PBP1A family penicillin-binding protein [Deltaproteobacteria bacterium]|nr:PBP1A family penicillin-binding protein [Deltaproteobacteria bacterium]